MSQTTSETEFGLLHRFRTSLIASLDLFISDAESDIEMELWDVHLNENVMKVCLLAHLDIRASVIFLGGLVKGDTPELIRSFVTGILDSSSDVEFFDDFDSVENSHASFSFETGSTNS